MHNITGKIYIAGPMRGYENFNFDAFDKAEQAMYIDSYHPISPAEMDRMYEGWGKYPPEDFVPTKADSIRFMRRDLAAIEDCEAIYLLRGWKDSKGAAVEKAYAEFLNLEIMYEEEEEEL